MIIVLGSRSLYQTGKIYRCGFTLDLNQNVQGDRKRYFLKIIETQYLLNFCKNVFRWGRRQEHIGEGGDYLGRVGEELKRIEGSEGEGVGGRGAWQEKERESMKCKSRNEGVKERNIRVVRRCGRVSNTVKTLEQGAKQMNKIISYFSKFGGGDGKTGESGHPLARKKLFVGVKRGLDVYENESENDDNCRGVGRSARK